MTFEQELLALDAGDEMLEVLYCRAKASPEQGAAKRVLGILEQTLDEQAYAETLQRIQADGFCTRQHDGR